MSTKILYNPALWMGSKLTEGVGPPGLVHVGYDEEGNRPVCVVVGQTPVRPSLSERQLRTRSFF